MQLHRLMHHLNMDKYIKLKYVTAKMSFWLVWLIGATYERLFIYIYFFNEHVFL